MVLSSIMPRKARIDAPGALHHVICRGIERKKIFRDDKDRDSFIERLGGVLLDTTTRCYAFALLPNHAHLLLKTGNTPVATIMRRLLTGYAVSFNRRYRRHGHLFQNRYKSILCQEDAYLLELVRYIHLNPLRAKKVAGLKDMESYPYSGHSRLMGYFEDEWQETDQVLLHFGKRVTFARKKYSAFVKEGIPQGRKPELTGGGLVRSAGGWQQLKMLRKMQVRIKSDERILGDADFVDSVIREAEEELEQGYKYKIKGYDFDMTLQRVVDLFEMEPNDIMGAVKQPMRVQARSLLCYWTVRKLGMSTVSVASKLGITQSAVSRSVLRGERLAVKRGYQLD